MCEYCQDLLVLYGKVFPASVYSKEILPRNPCDCKFTPFRHLGYYDNIPFDQFKHSTQNCKTLWAGVITSNF